MHKSDLSTSLRRGLSILTGASVALVAAPAFADVDLVPLVVIDLSTFDGSGFDSEPAAGQLDSDDWAVRLDVGNVVDFGGSAGGAGSDFARGLSTGGVDDPAIWAFDVDGAGLIGLGIQPTDLAFTPGQIALRLVNNTGADITEFQVEYTIWVNNDVGRSNSLNLQESPDDVDYTQVGDDFVSPLAADRDGFVATDVVQVVTPAAPITDGSQYYIAWAGDDVGGAGPTRDEFAIEGITIRLLNACGNGIMETDEGCDDGLGNLDTGACTSVCAVAACGDGFVQDGVEECDDANVVDGDDCAADCTIEDAGTETGADSTGADGTGSASDTDSAGTGSASNSATGASASDSDSDTDTDGDTDGDTDSGNGSGDGEASCSCRSSGGAAPVWGLLGAIGLGLARRRRR